MSALVRHASDLSTAAKVSSPPIVLKNSVFERRRSIYWKIIPPNGDISNDVFQVAVFEDKVPSFRREFRVEESFNTIRPRIRSKCFLLEGENRCDN